MDSIDILLALRVIIENIPGNMSNSHWLYICKCTLSTNVECRTNLHDATAENLSWFEQLGSNCFDLCPCAVQSGDLTLLHHCGESVNWNFVLSFKKEIADAICQTPSLYLSPSPNVGVNSDIWQYVSLSKIISYANRSTLQKIWDERLALRKSDLIEFFIGARLETQDSHKNCEFYEWALDSAPEILEYLKEIQVTSLGFMWSARGLFFDLIEYSNLNYMKRAAETFVHSLPSEDRNRIANYAFRQNKLDIFQWMHNGNWVKCVKFDGNGQIDIELFHFAYQHYGKADFLASFHSYIETLPFEQFDFLLKTYKGEFKKADTFLRLVKSKRYSKAELIEFIQRIKPGTLICANAQVLELLEEISKLHDFRYSLFGAEDWLPKFKQKIPVDLFFPNDYNERYCEYLDFEVTLGCDFLKLYKNLPYLTVWERILRKNSQIVERCIERRHYNLLLWLADVPDLFEDQMNSSSYMRSTVFIDWTITTANALLFWRRYKPTELVVQQIFHFDNRQYDVFFSMNEQEIRLFDWAQLDMRHISQFEYMKLCDMLRPYGIVIPVPLSTQASVLVK